MDLPPIMQAAADAARQSAGSGRLAGGASAAGSHADVAALWRTLPLQTREALAEMHNRTRFRYHCTLTMDAAEAAGIVEQMSTQACPAGLLAAVARGGKDANGFADAHPRLRSVRLVPPAGEAPADFHGLGAAGAALREHVLQGRVGWRAKLLFESGELPTAALPTVVTPWGCDLQPMTGMGILLASVEAGSPLCRAENSGVRQLACDGARVVAVGPHRCWPPPGDAPDDVSISAARLALENAFAARPAPYSVVLQRPLFRSFSTPGPAALFLQACRTAGTHAKAAAWETEDAALLGGLPANQVRGAAVQHVKSSLPLGQLAAAGAAQPALQAWALRRVQAAVEQGSAQCDAADDELQRLATELAVPPLPPKTIKEQKQIAVKARLDAEQRMMDELSPRLPGGAVLRYVTDPALLWTSGDLEETARGLRVVYGDVFHLDAGKFSAAADFLSKLGWERWHSVEMAVPAHFLPARRGHLSRSAIDTRFRAVIAEAEMPHFRQLVVALLAMPGFDTHMQWSHDPAEYARRPWSWNRSQQG